MSAQKKMQIKKLHYKQELLLRCIQRQVKLQQHNKNIITVCVTIHEIIAWTEIILGWHSFIFLCATFLYIGKSLSLTHFVYKRFDCSFGLLS